MKHPIGTKCWLIYSLQPGEAGTQVEVLSHTTPHFWHACLQCGTVGRDVEVTPGKTSACCCSLIPIEDPDGVKITVEEKETIA